MLGWGVGRDQADLQEWFATVYLYYYSNRTKEKRKTQYAFIHHHHYKQFLFGWWGYLLHQDDKNHKHNAHYAHTITYLDKQLLT